MISLILWWCHLKLNLRKGAEESLSLIAIDFSFCLQFNGIFTVWAMKFCFGIRFGHRLRRSLISPNNERNPFALISPTFIPFHYFSISWGLSEQCKQNKHDGAKQKSRRLWFESKQKKFFAYIGEAVKNWRSSTVEWLMKRGLGRY